MALGDRIAVLLDGGFAQIANARAKSIASRPRSGVARLFGDPTINLIHGRAAAASTGAGDLVWRRVAAAARELCRMSAGQTLHARPAAGGAAFVDAQGSAGTFAVDVVAVTPLNEKSRPAVRTPTGSELLASEAGDDEVPRRTVRAYRALRPRRRALFDAASGRRIAPASQLWSASVRAHRPLDRHVDKIYRAAASRRSMRSRRSTWTSARARSSRCSARPAAARPRRCA